MERKNRRKKGEIGDGSIREWAGENGYFWDYGKEEEKEEGKAMAAENGHEKGNKKRWGKWTHTNGRGEYLMIAPFLCFILEGNKCAKLGRMDWIAQCG